MTFGDKKNGEIARIRKVGKDPSNTIENVYLLDGLK